MYIGCVAAVIRHVVFVLAARRKGAVNGFPQYCPKVYLDLFVVLHSFRLKFASWEPLNALR
jgi:hypothetical protein